MNFYICLALALLSSYLCGSIPFGYIIGKMRGIDLRQHGSGNIGATNAVRVLGKKLGFSVFLLDFLKGFAPVLLWGWVATNCYGLQQEQVNLIKVLAGLLAILGHNYTCFLGFKGGKGVATSIGVVFGLLAYTLVAPLMLIAIWAVVFFISRYVSLASIVAACCLPLLVLAGSWYHGKFADGSWNKPLAVFSVVVALLVVLRHRSNIKRLLNGTEAKAFSKKNNS